MKITPMAKPAPAAPEARVHKMNTLATPVRAESEILEARASAQGEAAPQGLSEVAETPAPEVTKQLSPQYTALAKRERAILKLQEEFKAEKAAFEQVRGNQITLEDLRKDPFGALNKAGVTYDQLVKLPEAESPESLLKAEIAELKTRLESTDKRFEERDTESYEQALKVIQSDASLLVNSDPAFETIKAHGEDGISQVVELIKRVHEEEDEVLDVQTAAQMVEEALVERATRQYEMLSKITKVKAKLAPAEPEANEATSGKGPAKTLTNAMGAQRPLSARERAILAFQNKLK